MSDDYAFPQAMCRGLGAEPTGMGQPPVARVTKPSTFVATTPGLPAFTFDPNRFFWSTPIGAAKPTRAPQPGAGAWQLVGGSAQTRSGQWVWMPPPGQMTFMSGNSGKSGAWAISSSGPQSVMAPTSLPAVPWTVLVPSKNVAARPGLGQTPSNNVVNSVLTDGYTAWMEIFPGYWVSPVLDPWAQYILNHLVPAGVVGTASTG